MSKIELGDRVVVTGAAGFIASHLVDALLARRHEVVALDRRSIYDDKTSAANLVNAANYGRFRLHTVDLATADLEPLLAGGDTVFHLAAVPGVRGSWGPRFSDYVTSNVVATHQILTACERAGVRRLVFASSSSVYGSTDRPSRESDPTGPISPYGVTKLAAEQLCLAHAGRPNSRLTIVGLRYFTVYGPRQRAGMAINQVLLGALAGIKVPLYGDGTQRREFTYVDDIVTATLAAATVDTQAATVVNVGGGSSVAMLDILELVREVTGHPVPVIEADPQAGDVTSTEADLNLAHRILGYRPSIDLREGVIRQANWLTALPESLRMTLLPNQLEVSR